MAKHYRRSLALAVSLSLFLSGLPAATAEAEDLQAIEEAADEGAASNEENAPEEETDPFDGLDALEYHEMTFRTIRLEVVKGNDEIEEPHFKALVLFQNTSPYTIRNPVTSFEVTDGKGNSLAFAYAKSNAALLPGASQWETLEFESLADVTPGQNVKSLKSAQYDDLYGERIDDKSEIVKRGVHLFLNGKKLDAKIADPDGYRYVPAKHLLEAMGYKYTWNAKTSTFTAVKGKATLEHKIEAPQLKASGKIVKLDGQYSSLVNKTPMVSIDLLPKLSSDWTMAEGDHGDITVIAAADKSTMK